MVMYPDSTKLFSFSYSPFAINLNMNSSITDLAFTLFKLTQYSRRFKNGYNKQTSLDKK